jgi:hypothetical protein
MLNNPIYGALSHELSHADPNWQPILINKLYLAMVP